MNFYEAMQLGTCDLKPLIKATKDEKLKKKYVKALIVKNFACILFCIAVVTFFNNTFGVENAIVGVVTVIALMTFRFSNFDFKTGQSAMAMLCIFAIFIISPCLATMVNPLTGSIINFVSMMVIVVLSCHKVALSNQSTLILSYLLLYGYKINDINAYTNRVYALVLGGIIVAGIFYYKHRKIEFDNSFSDIIKDINFNSERTKWQLKLALGVTTVILIGEILNSPRVMWIALACMSVLQPDKEKIKYRSKIRYIFSIIGCLMFASVYLILPQEYRIYAGLLGGIMVGFSGKYSWQTSFNSFGALAAAVPIFGLSGAIIIRITSNIIGVIYSQIYGNAFDKISDKIFSNDTVPEMG